MGRKPVIGTCHLCGSHDKLSFEHVPPKSAFNDQPVREQRFENALDDPFAAARGRISQRGAGAYTLCASCNNNTGAWYSSDFATWCAQGMEVLRRSGGTPKLIYMHYVYPLRVLKQIYTMAFSMNSPTWQQNHSELVQFVLDRERRWLNPTYRAFVYFNTEGVLRRVGNNVLLYNIAQGRSQPVIEISSPPFGYVVTWDSTIPDGRLVEISHFRRYDYYDHEVAPLHLPVLPTHLATPLDYRTKTEILEQAARSGAEVAQS